MPAPVIRYAITNRHLHAADEGRSLPADTVPPAPREAQPVRPAGEIGDPDRGDGAAVAQGRDLRSPATALSAADLAKLVRQAHHLRTNDVDYLQLREKDLAPADLRALAIALRRVIPAGNHPRLLLNLGHPPEHAATLATALAVSVDGLHLPANSPVELPGQIRAAFARACRSTPILSTSAHTLAEVAAARADRIDLILFGPVFGKTVFGKTASAGTRHGETAADPAGAAQGELVTAAVGLDALAAAVRLAHPTPVLALGGLTAGNTQDALAAGAAGIAGIRNFLLPSR